ncbi:MAG TPA: energy transducer TonB, partial [Bryobacteraceae bacterium]|nr:energy transducer TonB [Bryobacteraceae bacterium]
MTSPVPVFRVPPQYTERARKAQIQGKVLLSGVVNVEGQIESISVKRSLHLDLDQKAIEAVQQWKFRPGTKDGQPVPVRCYVEVAFRLVNRPESEKDRQAHTDQAPNTGSRGEAGVQPTVVAPDGHDAQQRQMPIPVHRVEPQYTESAKRAGVEGTVLLSGVVDGDGYFQSIRVARSLHPELDQKAIEAAQEWRFRPGSLGGKVVPVKVNIEMAFRLLRSPDAGPATTRIEMSEPGGAPVRETSERLVRLASEDAAGSSRLRWSEGCPTCAKFVQKGITTKAVQNSDLVVYASLVDTGKNLRAYLTVKNRTPNRTFEVRPELMAIDVDGPNQKSIASIPPRRFIERAGSKSRNAVRAAALSGLGSSIPQ